MPYGKGTYGNKVGRPKKKNTVAQNAPAKRKKKAKKKPTRYA